MKDLLPMPAIRWNSDRCRHLTGFLTVLVFKDQDLGRKAKKMAAAIGDWWRIAPSEHATNLF